VKLNISKWRIITLALIVLFSSLSSYMVFAIVPYFFDGELHYVGDYNDHYNYLERGRYSVDVDWYPPGPSLCFVFYDIIDDNWKIVAIYQTVTGGTDLFVVYIDPESDVMRVYWATDNGGETLYYDGVVNWVWFWSIGNAES